MVQPAVLKPHAERYVAGGGPTHTVERGGELSVLTKAIRAKGEAVPVSTTLEAVELALLSEHRFAPGSNVGAGSADDDRLREYWMTGEQEREEKKAMSGHDR